MAGSRKWFVYTADDGTDYAIQLDESNTEAVMDGGEGDYSDTSEVNISVPRNITPRQVVYASNDRTREIRCTVLTAAQYGDIVGGTSVQTITDPIDDTQTLVLIRGKGEQISIPFAADTGQTDGDDT